MTAASTIDGVTVELWGTEFNLKPATRSVLKAAEEYERKLDEAKDADELVKLMGELLDIRVVPQNGKRKLASKIILEKWEADQVTLSQVLDFAHQIAEATERPT
jgi:hypothetical protein